MSETLLEITKALVLAQIKAQHVTPENLRQVLNTTYDALHELQTIETEDHDGQVTGLPGRGAEPKESNWKKSITKHAIKCLECGTAFKQLSRRHLKRHGLDSRSYRIKYGIPAEQPLSARVATARRRELAQSIRPWEKAQAARLLPKRSNGSARSQVKRIAG